MQLSKAERESIQKKIDILRAESGVEQVFSTMIENSKKKALNETNLNAAMHDLSNLLKAISQAVIREEKHWLSELQKAGWSPNDKYKKLNETKNNVEAWIKVESEKVATNLEALMLKALLDYLMKANGKVDSGEVLGIVRKIWNDELLRYKDDWAQRFADEYSKAYKQFSNEPTNLQPPELGKITDELTNLVMSVLESFKEAGLRTTAIGILGAVVCVLAPAAGGLPLVGSALATIAMVAGPVLIGIAAIPLIPAIYDKIKERKEQYRKEIEGRLREWMREINMAPPIAVILQNQNETLYRHYRDEMDINLLPLLDSYELCGKIKEGMVELNDIISFNFPEYFSKG